MTGSSRVVIFSVAAVSLSEWRIAASSSFADLPRIPVRIISFPGLDLAAVEALLRHAPIIFVI